MSEKQVSILLVEDDPVDQMAVQRLIRKNQLPYTLTVAASVAEAVSILETSKPDIAFIDYNLPDGIGTDIQAAAEGIPCIFITGMDKTSVAVTAMKQGAYDFLLKDSRRDYLNLLPSLVDKTLTRKAAEEQIALQQHMIASLGEMVFLLDESARVVFVNEAVSRILGFERDELLGRPWGEGYVSDLRIMAYLNHEIVRYIGENEDKTETMPPQMDVAMKCKNGKVIWTSWSQSRYMQDRLTLVGRDITRRKQIEEALLKSQMDLEKRVVERTQELSKTNQRLLLEIEENNRKTQALKDSELRFKTLFDRAADAILIHNLKGDILDVNIAACKRLGYTYEELIDFNILDIIGEDQTGELFNRLKLLHQDEESLYESSWQTRNGTVVLIEVNSQIIDYRGGQAILSASRDITLRKKAEKALVRSEEKYRSLVENLSEIIFILDAGQNFTYLSPVIEHISGYRPEEMIGRNFFEFIHEDDIEMVEQHFKAVHAGSKESHTFRMVAKDKSIRNIRCSSRLLLDEGQFIGCTGILSDYTEQKLTQDALIKSQNLADIGTLTGGVMHEIKSPLQVITGISDSLGRRLKNNEIDLEKAVQQLENINRNAWRINAIANSLLNYAHFSTGDIELHFLNDIVTDTLLLIEHQLSTWSNISVETELAEALSPFECDRNKITQVLINLLTNARDAMPVGGKILIQTGTDDENRNVYMRVSDTGEGIPLAIQDKIFNTFFTTKPKGAGTGLGLSIIQEIVQAHHGTIDFSSQEKVGTTFTINFPLKNKEK